MVADTIINLEALSKNSLGNSWNSVWTPNIKGINRSPTIFFTRNIIRDKTQIYKERGLSWTDVRSLLDREKFRNWETDGTPAARNRNDNAIFMFNGTKEDINNFIRQFQENIM